MAFLKFFIFTPVCLTGGDIFFATSTSSGLFNLVRLSFTSSEVDGVDGADGAYKVQTLSPVVYFILTTPFSILKTLLGVLHSCTFLIPFLISSSKLM